jgi:hypothetical protein
MRLTYTAAYINNSSFNKKDLLLMRSRITRGLSVGQQWITRIDFYMYTTKQKILLK